MKSGDAIDTIKTWEKIYYYALAIFHVISHGAMVIVYLFYYLFWKISALLGFLVPKKKEQSPFGMLKSQKVKKKLLLLDLDGTLINSTAVFSSGAQRIKVGRQFLYVNKRAYLSEFITEMEKLFTLGIYTSSVKEYADKAINAAGLDKAIPKHMRFYRDSCEYFNGNYMKRVTKIEPDLRNVLILDNSPEVILDRKNLVVIQSWVPDNDVELLRCIDKLRLLYDCYDVRALTSKTL